MIISETHLLIIMNPKDKTLMRLGFEPTIVEAQQISSFI